MTSRLIKQDNEFYYLNRYIHADDDSYSDWHIDQAGNFLVPKNIIEADASAAYELKMEYRIRKSDAEVIIDSVK